jgi:colanic acid/amylovoran biosynthesis glycosyltransferase
MKAVFCTFDIPNFVAGPNTWLLRLLPELCGHGIESRVLALSRSEVAHPATDALRAAGIDCRVTPWPRYTEPAVDWMLRELARDPPDVFVPNCLAPGFLAARWAREAGIPTVAVMHSEDPFHQGLVREFVAGGPREFRLSSLVCVSRFLEESVLARNPEGSVIRRIPCGVPLPAARAAEPGDALRLIYMGRMDQEAKRIVELTRALCRAVREVPGTEGDLYGDGPYESRVREILRTDGRGLPVRLNGRVDGKQVYDRLLDAHVQVLLSDYEGMPIALMEGMACGLVPVCLKIRGGVSELVEDGVTGLLVDDRGDAFVRAVRRLREERGLWKTLADGARSRAEAGYTSGYCAAQWAELLRQLAANTGPRRPLSWPDVTALSSALPPPSPGLDREDVRIPRGADHVLRPLRRAIRVSRRLSRALFAKVRPAPRRSGSSSQ